ncbi:MAG: TIM barrel protein, partial [Candidatus Omnitrophota bacterium]
MRLGVHISMQGGLNEALKRARALGCDTMQIFSRNPRGWGGAAAFDPRELAVFAAAREKERFSPLVVHVPYLINLASPDDTIYAKSVESFTGDIKVSGEIGAEYFVTHLGSHRGSGEKIGIERFAAALNKAFSAVAPGVMVLLETTAGAGDSIGSKFEH